MSSLSISILLLSFCCIVTHAATSDPTEIPTVEPTMEPSFNPTTEPTTDTISPTRSPTKFPTETPASISLLEVICLDNNNNKITKYNMSLTEENGFNNNKYGKTSLTSPIADDIWNISNINIPIIDHSNTCYLHIYLSNNDYFGYRDNATCTLSYTIDKNTPIANMYINDTTLNLYNILDINQKYNTFWELKTLSNKTSLFFASYPTCQPLTGLSDENINFANVNVDNFILTSDFDNIINENNGETLISQNGLWPYYFYLASDQLKNTTHFKIRAAFEDTNPTSGPSQTCQFDQSLPVYNLNNNNISQIIKGGIDYYLFVNSTANQHVQISTNLSVNIEIKQICHDVLQPTMQPTEPPTQTKEKKEDEFPLTLGLMILLAFCLCFVCMALCNLFIWCTEDKRDKDDDEMTLQMESLTDNEIMDKLNIIEDDTINEINEAEMARFVVTQEEHQEMVDILRRGSMSTGLE